MAARTAADGKWKRRTARMAADGVGAREWLEMGGEKQRMGKEGTGGERKGQEGKGRERMGKEGKGNGKEGKGRERKGKEEKGRERMGKEGKGRERSGEDGCGRPGCKEVAGNGWGEEAAGDERPWLRGRLRTANGCEELRGWLRTAWVKRGGWKWVE